MVQLGASYLTKTVKFHLVVGTIFYPHPKLFVTSPDPQGAGDYQKKLGFKKSCDSDFLIIKMNYNKYSKTTIL